MPNNIIDKEDLLPMYNAITIAIENAEKNYPNDIRRQRQAILSSVNSIYGDNRPVNEKRSINICQGAKRIDLIIFELNGRIYYWWDLVNLPSLVILASGLEFYPFCDDNVSFLLFSTRPDQDPLVYTLNIRK